MVSIACPITKCLIEEYTCTKLSLWLDKIYFENLTGTKHNRNQKTMKKIQLRTHTKITGCLRQILDTALVILKADAIFQGHFRILIQIIQIFCAKGTIFFKKGWTNFWITLVQHGCAIIFVRLNKGLIPNSILSSVLE